TPAPDPPPAAVLGLGVGRSCAGAGRRAWRLSTEGEGTCHGLRGRMSVSCSADTVRPGRRKQALFPRKRAPRLSRRNAGSVGSRELAWSPAQGIPLSKDANRPLAVALVHLRRGRSPARDVRAPVRPARRPARRRQNKARRQFRPPWPTRL